MGFKIAASCKCGYHNIFRFGGTRSSHLTESYCPHYCQSCGMVSVNIARQRIELSAMQKLRRFFGMADPETAEVPLRCPSCASVDIKRYGREPLLTAKRSEMNINWGNDYLDAKYNFCPSCQQYSMCCDIYSFTD